MPLDTSVMVTVTASLAGTGMAVITFDGRPDPMIMSGVIV